MEIRRNLTNEIETLIDLHEKTATIKIYKITNKFNISTKRPVILKKARRLVLSEEDSEFNFKDEFGEGQAVSLTGEDSEDLVEKIEDTLNDFMESLDE